MTRGIYQIKNIDTGKRYVGSSNNIQYRLWQHLRTLRLGTHKNKHLQNAWNNSLKADWQTSTLQLCSDQDDLAACEQKWIDLFDTGELYNINLKVEGTPNQSAETRRKIGDALRGKKLPGETVQKMVASRTGLKRSDATRQRMSIAQTGKRQSEATRQKLREINTGNKHTAEAKEKIAKAGTGRVQSEKTRQKLSEQRMGKPVSEATKRGLAEYHKRRRELK